MDWIANRAADELAKAAAHSTRVDKTTRRKLDDAWQTARHWRCRLGEVTYAASNKVDVTVDLEGNSTETRRRDADGKPSGNLHRGPTMEAGGDSDTDVEPIEEPQARADADAQAIADVQISPQSPRYFDDGGAAFIRNLCNAPFASVGPVPAAAHHADATDMTVDKSREPTTPGHHPPPDDSMHAVSEAYQCIQASMFSRLQKQASRCQPQPGEPKTKRGPDTNDKARDDAKGPMHTEMKQRRHLMHLARRRMGVHC